jgi:hypothetical protein
MSHSDPRQLLRLIETVNLEYDNPPIANLRRGIGWNYFDLVDTALGT